MQNAVFLKDLYRYSDDLEKQLQNKENNSFEIDNKINQTQQTDKDYDNKSVRSKESGKSKSRRSSSSGISYTAEQIGLDNYETDPFFGLNFLQASLMATILEDILTAFYILEECNTTIRISKALNDLPNLIAKKYSISQALVQHELDDVDEKKINSNEYKLYKLERDRQGVKNLLLRLYMDLVLAHSFRSLWNSVVDAENQSLRAYDLAEQETKYKAQLKTLQKNLRQQRNHIRTELYDFEAVMDSLKKQKEDAEQTAAVKGRYLKRWQGASMEQHDETIRRKEMATIDSIHYYKSRAEQEARVHSEIDLLVMININENLKKIENWMNKYDDDMEMMDVKIQIEKNEYQNARDQRRDLERKFSMHEKEMRDWLKFKEDRAAAHKYHNDMMCSAIVIQAWWRGLLVRKQLGPYRPKRKGRSKNK